MTPSSTSTLRLRDPLPPEKIIALGLYRLGHENSFVSIEPSLMVFQAIRRRKNLEIERELERTKLPDRIVFHVTLTTVDSYRCDSYCLAQLFENCLTHPTITVSSVFCLFAKFLPKRKTWGRTRQMPKTDFHRTVNKFWQDFPSGTH